MNFLEAIKSRRAVRAWRDKHVSNEKLAKVLNAARFAPSPLNSQPWHLVVIRKKEILKKLATYAKHGPFISGANVVIVVCADKDVEIDQWLKQHHQHVYSVACAIENMWLAAWHLGLGACWVSLEEKNTRELLDIPKRYLVIGCLALGYPANKPEPHSRTDRKPLSAIVSYEKFNEK